MTPIHRTTAPQASHPQATPAQQARSKAAGPAPTNHGPGSRDGLHLSAGARAATGGRTAVADGLRAAEATAAVVGFRALLAASPAVPLPVSAAVVLGVAGFDQLAEWAESGFRAPRVTTGGVIGGLAGVAAGVATAVALTATLPVAPALGLVAAGAALGGLAGVRGGHFAFSLL